jgi:hypothetical protein
MMCPSPSNEPGRVTGRTGTGGLSREPEREASTPHRDRAVRLQTFGGNLEASPASVKRLLSLLG